MLNKYLSVILAVMFIVSCSSTDSNVNYGLNHYNMGLFIHAIPSLLKSVPKLEKSDPSDERVTSGYLALGVMAQSDELFDKAEAYLVKALETSNQVKLNKAIHIRNANNTLGNFYITQKQYDKALVCLNVAMEISKKENFDMALIAIDLDNLAVVHSELGEHEKSLNLSIQALEYNEKNTSHKYYLRTKAIIYFNLAKTYGRLNKKEMVIDSYDKSIAALELLVQSQTHEKWRLDLVISDKVEFENQQKN